MTTYILELIERLSHRLPGQAPVITIRIIAKIHLVAGSVQRNTVGSESCDSVGLGIAAEHVASRVVGDYRSRVLCSQVVGP